MKFVEVKEVPGRTIKKNLYGYLNEFMTMDIKVAKVEFNKMEYKTVISAYLCIYRAVQKSRLPLRVMKRNDEIFLVRNDM